jgi:ATP-binding cassette subfamily B protein
MDQLSGYAHRPFPFVMRYLRERPVAHLIILTCVVGAVACSVGTQYGVKFLVDSLSAGPHGDGKVWAAFALLMVLIATDNVLWRVASWTASFTFVRVTGDLRRDSTQEKYISHSETLTLVRLYKYDRTRT